VLIRNVLRVSLPILFVLSLTGLATNIYGDFHLARFTLNAISSVIILTAWGYTTRERFISAFNVILYGALIIFGSSTLMNGGVRVPNYTGFFGILVLASVFSSNRFIWLTYLIFIAIGASTLIYPLYDEASITFPADHRYYAIYGVIGLIISSCLILTRRAFNQMVIQLSEREELLSSIFQSITTPLLVFNELGESAYINPSAQELDELIYSAHETHLIELPMFDMSSKSECTLSSMIKERSFEDVIRTYKVNTTIKQSSAWYSISISPYSSTALGSGALMVMRDITEQQRLTQNQKMRAVGRLANGIAHDFNNMLGVIKSSSDLLMLDLDDEEHHELLELIHEATDRSANMIKQLRLFSKRSDSEETVINLSELLYDVRVMLQSMNQHSHAIHIASDEGDIWFQGVREQLHSMLINLGLNALQSMEAEGVLSFCVKLERRGVNTAEPLSPELTALPHDSSSQRCVVIEVTDQGCGISPDLQERIFEPFFTTRKQGEGQGLGLSIVHGAVERHQGVIEVMSQIGAGTTMRVTLPQREELSLSPTPINEASEQSSFDGLSLLIIDDEAMIRQSLSAMCRSLGFIVTTADSGDQGLERIRERLELTQESSDLSVVEAQYDLIILDMLMPGKNGHEVFIELQGLAPQLPVILSSGYYPEDALAEMNQKGLAGQLHKPYGLEQVRAVISRVIAQRSWLSGSAHLGQRHRVSLAQS